MKLNAIGSMLLNFMKVIGLPWIAAICAILVVLFWANPITTIPKLFGSATSSVNKWLEGETKQVTRTTITAIKKTGRLKVLTCYAGDFLDAPYKPEQRELATYLYQWEGFGEYVLDLNDVKIEVNETVELVEYHKGNETITREQGGTRKLFIQAKAPFLDLDTVRTLPISPRCEHGWNKLGHSEELGRLRRHILQFVSAALEDNLSTSENRARAKGNAEKLLRALCAPTVKDPQNDITIQWID